MAERNPIRVPLKGGWGGGISGSGLPQKGSCGGTEVGGALAEVYRVVSVQRV